MKILIRILSLCLVAPLGVAQVCNPAIQETAPDSRYQILSVGAEVLDLETGLIWRRCAEGQTLNNGGTLDTSDDSCEGSPMSFDWSGALQLAATEAARTGQTWTLPDIKQVDSLAELACVNPAINTRVFPGAVSNVFWSSSPSDSAIWVLGFFDGSDAELGASEQHRVRLMRRPE